MTTDSFTEQRRQQKRPGCQPVVLTSALLDCLTSQLPIIAADPSPQGKVLINGINNFTKSSYAPDDYQKLMACVSSVWKTKEAKDLLSGPTVVAIATGWLVPWLCRCDLRFVHKGIINLLRADIVTKCDASREAVVVAFKAHLAKELEGVLAVAPADADSDNAGPASSPSTSAAQPLYMRCANFIDAISVSASPIFPQVFEELFPRSIIVCSEIMSDCVMAAINKSIDTPCIHSSNLEDVRFVVRVVATHVHRYISTIPARCEANRDEGLKVFAGPLATLLFASTAMLSTAAFPKDVLNAAGLLVATIMGSAHHNVTEEMVKDLCTEAEDKAVTTEAIRAAARAVMQSLLSAAPSPAEEKKAIATLFARVVPNGRFAFYKGLLSHFSSPMYNKANTILMRPVGGSNATILHDTIFAVAKRFSDEQREPDTRFMAVQTLDHIVTYLASTFEELLGTKGSGKNKRSNNATAPAADVAAPVLPDWFVPSTVIAQTQATVLDIVSIITGRWDDPTQQVSGPLYATYSNILDVSDALQRLTTAQNKDGTVAPAVVDPLTSFQAALRVRADRRGKYHTMLALLSRLDDAELLVALRSAVTGTSAITASTSDVMVFQHFVETVIVTANNPKICSVSGDLFAVMASRFLAKEDNTSPSSYWHECIIKAVTNVLTSPTLTTGLSVTDTMARGNIVTHMVTPVLKQGVMGARLLHDLLRHWAMLSSSAATASSHLVQATVDLLYRARSAGVSLEAVGTDVWAIVRIAGDAYDTTLRLAALNLLILSTKSAERVTSYQLSAAARLVELYSQNGGDSTTRNDTLGVLRLWFRRLVDSLAVGVKKEEGDADVFAAYVKDVFAHLKAVVACIVRYVSKDPVSGNMAGERRFFCMSALEMLWGTVGTFLADDSSKIATNEAVLAIKAEVLAALYPAEALRDALKATLYEGWDMLRELAARLLGILCDKASPCSVFPNAVEELKKSVAELSSGTHRVAQGGARVVVTLFQFSWGAIVSGAAALPDGALKPLPNIAAGTTASAYAQQVIVGVCDAFAAECVMVDVLTNAAMIRAAPLHGRLILAGALFASCVAPEGPSSPSVIAVAQRILATCTKTTEYCSGLVSGSDKVDCRGHVFSEGDAAKESDNRVIVNNSWLGVRAACAVSEKLLSLCPATAVGDTAILALCKSLVLTLLLTKHNGVMGKARASLRFICRLLLKTRCDVLRGIPTILINDLLGESGVGSSDEGRILRRSQGLPHAILPILEAEDASLPLVLFPKTMTLLTDLIGIAQEQGTGATSIAVAHSINALNVLKFIFDNSIFASRVTPWSEDAFIKAAAGFNNSNWAVRNSSLMLFSSVIHRVVGDHPTKGGGGVTTSLHDLQLRIPNGLAYAIDALKTAVDRTAGGFAVDPALFPLLLLCSMLCPDAPHVVHDQSSGHMVSQLITVLQRCGSLRNVMVRAASGSALVAIVPVADLEGIVTKLIADTTAAASSADQNTIHGNIQHLQKVYAHYVGTLRIDVKNALGAHSNDATRQQMLGLMAALVASPACVGTVRCMPVAASFLALAADVLAAHSAEAEADVKAMVGIAVNSVAVATNALKLAMAAEDSGVGHRGDIGAFSDALGLMLVVAGQRLAVAGATAAVAPLTAAVKAMLADEHVTRVDMGSRNKKAFGVLVQEKVLASIACYHRASTAQRFSGKAYLVRKVFAAPAASSSSVGGIAAQTIVAIERIFEGIAIIPFALNVLKVKVNAASAAASSAFHPQVCEDSFIVLSIVARDATTAGAVVSYARNGVTLAAMCKLIATDENSGMRGALLEFAAMSVANNAATGDDSTEVLLRSIELASRSDQPTVCRTAAVFALCTLQKKEAKAGNMTNNYGLLVAITALWMRLLHDDEEDVRRTTVYAAKQSNEGISAAAGGLALSQPSTVEALLSAVSAADKSTAATFDATPFVNAVFNAEGEAAEEHGDDANVADEDEDEEDLFDEEDDNMYWEDAVMQALRAKLTA